MTRTRRSSNSARVTTRSEDLSKLSSEVLKLCLQALNLPITGSKAQLLVQLKRTSTGKANQSQRRPGRPHRTRHTVSKTTTQQQPSTAGGEVDATHGQRLSIPAYCSPIQRKISSLLIIEMPSIHRSVLPSRTSYPGLYTALWTPSVQTAPSAQRPPANHSQLRVWRLLWVRRGQWTVIWRTKYSGVSTLILPYFYPTTCISPRPLKFSSAWMTHPQVPWVPPSPWLGKENLLLTHFRSGWRPTWCTCWSL